MSLSLRWLVPPAHQALSPNRYGAGYYRPDYVNDVDCLILHYTAGYGYAGAVRWLTNAGSTGGVPWKSQASAHFVTGRAGEQRQLVPLSDRAWHAGGRSSRWRGRPVNSRSIGIEIANLGPLKPRADGQLLDCWGRPFTGEPFQAEDGSMWEPYPQEQVDSVLWLVTSLVGIFPRLQLQDAGSGELPRICTHEDVDPSRKTDTGPAFPLDELRDAALARVASL